jgi:restriction system protein
MTVPSYDRFIEPVLRYLSGCQEPVATREVQEAAAAALNLSAEDKSETLPSGAQAVYRNRVGWAHDRLKRRGYSTSPRRGYWQLTRQGRSYVDSHRAPLSEDEVKRIADDGFDPRQGVEVETNMPSVHPLLAPAQIESPDDRLETAVAELRATTRDALLEELARVSPTFFETIVLDVLHKIGYGAGRSDLRRVGGSGDGGIDGIISLDRLGLEKVYVQAKRWQNSVGRPEVQAFYGALAGQRATKGVFITTSTFTAQAHDFVRSVERLVLVDGNELADLMIEYEVGVTMRPVRVPKLDADYFEEQ